MAFQHSVGDWSVYLDEAADAFYYFHQKTKITTWIRPDELGGPESEDDADDQPPPPPAEEPETAKPPRRLSALEVLNQPLSPGKLFTPTPAPTPVPASAPTPTPVPIAKPELKLKETSDGSNRGISPSPSSEASNRGNSSPASDRKGDDSSTKGTSSRRQTLLGRLTTTASEKPPPPPPSPEITASMAPPPTPKALESLQEVFASPVALEFFTKFAMQQRCSENILFWQKAQEYLHEKGVSPEGRKERAIVLCKNFLKSGAPFEINCGKEEVERIETLINEEGDLQNIFVGLQNHIFAELSRATFANFKKSPQFTEAALVLQVQAEVEPAKVLARTPSRPSWQNTCLGPGPCTHPAGRNPDPKSIYNKSDYCLKHQYLCSMEPFKIDSELEAVHRVATEMLTSEATYRECLRSAYQGFYLHLKARLDLGRPKISKSAIGRVFMNLEKVYQLSCQLHDDLVAAQADRVLVQQLPALMLFHAPAFQCYQIYLEGYDDSMHKLNRERIKKEKFNSWLLVHEKVEGAQLPSLLIMPVQRLPRYALLLKEFKRFLPASSNLHYDADSAITKLTDTISTINVALNLRDRLRKLQEIEEMFDKTESEFIPFAEKPETRFLILQGDLMRPEMVRRRKSIFSIKETEQTTNPKYHFFLFSDLLVYAIGQGTRMFKHKMRGYMPLSDLTVEKDTLFDDNQINVTDIKGKRFKLKADDTATRDMWFSALSTAIQGATEASDIEAPSLVLGKAL